MREDRLVRNISHPFVFTQDYRRFDELPPPNDFPIFSESFSIGKIYIESAEDIVIRNILIQAYFFRSKQAMTNPVKLALIMGDDLEYKLSPNQLLIDSYSGILTPIIPGENPEVSGVDMIHSNPYIAAYQSVLEYGSLPYDYLNPASLSNYRNASAMQLIKDERISQMFLIQGSTYQSPGEIVLKNSNQFRYLYIIPFTPQLQKTMVASSGLINFEVEY